MIEIEASAVLFDLDGVLVDSQTAVDNTWSTWCRRHGVDFDALIATAYGRPSRPTIEQWRPDLDIDAEEAWLERLEIEGSRDCPPISGAPALTRSLPGDRWAIFTSGTLALASARLDAVGIEPPAVFLTADDIARGKPAPDGYREAAVRLGVDVASAVVVEDSVNGIAAARAAGALVLALTTAHDADELDGDWIVPDLAGVRACRSAAGVRLQIV